MENLRLILIMSEEILIGRGTTVQHRLCAVCTLHFVLTDRSKHLIIGHSFGCLRRNYEKYCGLFLPET